MKKLILILAVSLFWTTNFYAQQWHTDDVSKAKMQYDENGFLEEIPDPNLHETNTNNIGTKAPTMITNTFPTPEFLWHYKEHTSYNSACWKLHYESENNTVFTVGEIGPATSSILTIIEYDASSGDVNYFKDYNETNTGHQPTRTNDLVIDSEGDVLITGTAWHPVTGLDGMIMKFDRTTQDTAWTLCFPGAIDFPVADWSFGITTDIDNNVIVVGLIQRVYNNQPHKFCVIYKLNSDGDVLWMEEVGEIFGGGRNVVTDDQGNIYVQGEFIQEIGVDEASVLKMDPDGNILWKNGTSSLYNNPLWAWNIIINNSGELFVGGTSRPAGSTTGKDFAVAQLDKETGEFLWVSTPINGAVDSTDICKHLVYDEISDAIYAGGTIANDFNGSYLQVDFCMARFDAADGTLGWVYEFDGDPNDAYGKDLLYDMVFDPEGYVIATGETFNAVYYYTDETIITYQDWITVKLDAETGDVHWMSLIDKEWDDYPFFVGPQKGWTVDVDPSTGKVFAGGYMMSIVNEEFLHDYAVIGLSTELVDISENLLQGSTQYIQNYPNPFNDFTTLTYSLEKETQVKIVIRDLSGRIVTNLLDKKQLAGEHTVNWDATNLSGNHMQSGIYFCTINMGASTSTIKLIVQR